MRTNFSNQATLLAWGALTLAVVIAGASQSQAQVEIAPPTKSFGAAVAAIGQTIRVNVSSFDDPGEFQGVTCNVGVNILGLRRHSGHRRGVRQPDRAHDGVYR